MRRLFSIASFLLFYIKEVVVANLRVAHDVLTPRHHMTPSILSVNVTGMSERQLLFMANLITMTPGTLGLSFSQDYTTLYIHAMYVDSDVQTLSQELENTYGKRVRSVF